MFNPGHAIGHEAEHQALAQLLSANATSKNLLLNASMEVQQRWPSGNQPAVVSGNFVLDRWLHIRDGTVGTVSMFQSGFTPGTNLGGVEGTFFLRLNQTVSGTAQTFKGIEQRIEEVRTLSGQKVTVSFWARSTNTTTINARLDQVFGVGGSGSVFGATASFNLLANTWTYCTYTTTLGSCLGLTVGAGSYTQLILYEANSTVNTLDFAFCVVEPGGQATPFAQIRRTFGEELVLCKRFYQKSFGYSTLPTQNIASGREMFSHASNGANGLWSFTFPTPMRNTPALTFFNPGAANAFAINFKTGTSATATTANAITERNFELITTPPAGWTQGDILGVQWTAENEL